MSGGLHGPDGFEVFCRIARGVIIIDYLELIHPLELQETEFDELKKDVTVTHPPLHLRHDGQTGPQLQGLKVTWSTRKLNEGKLNRDTLQEYVGWNKAQKRRLPSLAKFPRATSSMARKSGFFSTKASHAARASM